MVVMAARMVSGAKDSETPFAAILFRCVCGTLEAVKDESTVEVWMTRGAARLPEGRRGATRGGGRYLMSLKNKDCVGLAPEVLGLGVWRGNRANEEICGLLVELNNVHVRN